ncbi:transposase, partial [Streptomyces sp. NPDC051658]|uniref:transposase n=1 Tax=Streptomyces sp. NPDC051658 TaxID=3365667 RepID=UPI0037A970CB
MTSDNVTEVETVEPSEAAPAKSVDDRLIDELVGRAQAEGLQLTGEGGLLQQLTKRLLESALEGEITDHLGYDKHDPAGKNGGNSRNGTRGKTVLTATGEVQAHLSEVYGAEVSRQTISTITDKVLDG